MVPKRRASHVRSVDDKKVADVLQTLHGLPTVRSKRAGAPRTHRERSVDYPKAMDGPGIIHRCSVRGTFTGQPGIIRGRVVVGPRVA